MSNANNNLEDRIQSAKKCEFPARDAKHADIVESIVRTVRLRSERNADRWYSMSKVVLSIAREMSVSSGAVRVALGDLVSRGALIMTYSGRIYHP